ncbi:carbohydrate ABC transporter permease [Miniimonas arenae]|uniref:Carbohydrate ABC transporter permease n=1 Tax=Miniimonas arenae TaxID=676201 RepID=A0A5C5BH20_9MICO|nr:carbohydrate ABC transporter permease [Miniimonas arenae]TNU76823.1 carbohydrate ABC transporter permease [Miniimonas arenae]
MSSLPVVAQTAGPRAARAAARRRGSGGVNRRPRWVTYVILAVVIVISIFPLYYTAVLGSSDQQAISRDPFPQLFPDLSLFDRFAEIMGSTAINFWNGAVNSAVIAVVVSLSTVLFSTLAGFSFAKLRFRGRGPLLVFVIATMAVPTQLGVIPMYILATRLGWVGSIEAVIVPALVTAFGVFWMTQYLGEALPYELVEAARVDGASVLRTFWSVALPAARPAAAMLALFTFVAQWTNFFWPSIVLNQSNPTLPIVVRSLQATYFVDYSLLMAGVLLVTLPLIVVFLFTGKQLVAGIMQGAVKG